MLTALLMLSGNALAASAPSNGSSQSTLHSFTYKGYTYTWSRADASDVTIMAAPGAPDKLPAGVDPASIPSTQPVSAAEALAAPNGCTGVPDSYFGADFKPACDKHDQCYSPPSTTDRIDCDRTLESDLVVACINTFGQYNPLRYTCVGQAGVYYNGVRLFRRSHYQGQGNPA